MRRRGQPYVYFVRRADGEGPVKIGCSQVPAERLAALMAWAPYPLEVVATIAGDEALERRFHARFIAQHSHREWFRPSADLTLVIAQIQAGVFDVEELPSGKRVSNPSRRPWSVEQRLNASNTRRLKKLRALGVHIPAEISALTYARYRRDPADRERATRRVADWLDAAECAPAAKAA